jgi:hypothetical protein
MARRLVGEFSPPRELVAIAAPRMSGRGTVEVSEAGVTFDGRLMSVEPPIPAWSSAVVLLVGLVLGRVFPGSEAVLLPASLVAVVGIVGWRYRAELGTTRAHTLAWTELEHVVRLQSQPDVLAFVLTKPIGGRNGPEQLFFEATEGWGALADAVTTFAPGGTTIRVALDLEDPDPPDAI